MGWQRPVLISCEVSIAKDPTFTYTHTHTHTHTLAHTHVRTHTHPHTRARAHAHTHAHTYTHTHTHAHTYTYTHILNRAAHATPAANRTSIRDIVNGLPTATVPVAVLAIVALKIVVAPKAGVCGWMGGVR